MINRLFLSIALFLLAGLSLCADSAEKWFYEANKFYDEGQYDDALSSYSKMNESGIESGEVYFNMGNASYRLGLIGEAILYYEKANKYLVEDEDLFANTAYMQSLVLDSPPKDKLVWYEQIWERLVNLFESKEWFLAICLLYAFFILTLLLGIYFYRLRKKMLTTATVLGVCIVLLSLLFFSRNYIDKKLLYGVIIQSEVDVRYSPSFDGAVAFKVHEGLKTRVLYCDQEWCQIRLTQDQGGWVNRTSIKMI